MINKIISLIIIGLVVFLLGAGAGILFQNQKYALQFEKFQTLTSALKPLSSKAIPVMHAVGIVEKISGRKITLIYEGERVLLSVPENAKVYLFGAIESTDTPKRPTFGQKESAFENIKTGDRLNVSLTISPDGQIEVTSIIIMPPSQKT